MIFAAPTSNTKRLLVSILLGILMCTLVSLIPFWEHSDSIVLEQDAQCLKTLEEMVKALDFSSLKQYERHLVDAEEPLPCGLKQTLSASNLERGPSQFPWIKIFNGLFERNSASTRTQQKIAQDNDFKRDHVIENESSSQRKSGLAQQNFSLPSQKSGPAMRAKIALPRSAKKSRGDIVLSRRKDVSEPSVPTLTKKPASGRKLSPEEYSDLETEAVKLGYELVPADLNQRAAALGFEIHRARISTNGDIHAASNKMLVDNMNFNSTELPKLSRVDSSSEFGSKSTMAVAASHTSEEQKKEVVASNDDARLHQEAIIEAAMQVHLKSEANSAKAKLRMEAAKKTQQAQSAAIEAIQRYAGVLSFAQVDHAATDKLYLSKDHVPQAEHALSHHTIAEKMREAEQKRAEAGEAADKQLAAYAFLDFSDDGIHSSSKLQLQTDAPQTTRLTSPENNKKAIGIEHQSEMSTEVSTRLSAGRQWTGKGIPRFHFGQ